MKKVSRMKEEGLYIRPWEVDSCISAMERLLRRLEGISDKLRDVCRKYEPGSDESRLCTETLTSVNRAIEVMKTGGKVFAFVGDAIIGLCRLDLDDVFDLSRDFMWMVSECIEPYLKEWREWVKKLEEEE